MNKDHFLIDCLQAVCLLVEDGLKIVFAHRSFQEYFTARFIAESQPEVQFRLIQKYSSRIRIDGVFSLLYEIRPDVIEKHFLLPRLDELFQTIGYEKGQITIEQFLRFEQVAHSTIEFAGKDYLGISGTVNQNDSRNFSDIASFTLWNCGSAIGWKGFAHRNDNLKFLAQRYGSDDGSPKEYDLSKATIYDSLIKDLFERGSYFSVETLTVMAKIRELLKSKAEKKEASLEEILKNEG